MSGRTFARSPYADSFSEALLQLPGAAPGANGVVHLNGDHGVINYTIDGVPLPQALNREIGSEIDPSNVALVDVLEGAYPAQYGTRFGSYADVDETLGYHAPLGNGGGLTLAARSQRSTRGLDPSDFDSPHNDASDENQFAASRWRAVEVRSPTSRRFTASARSKFRATCSAANPRRPTTTRNKKTRF